MSTSRYSTDPRISLGQQLGVSQSIRNLRTGLKQGYVRVQSALVMTGTERLDVLAGQIYGDARLWWVLAAASGIGWGLQMPPGTLITIPKLDDVMKVI